MQMPSESPPPPVGQYWFDPATPNVMKYFDGSKWIDVTFNSSGQAVIPATSTNTNFFRLYGEEAGPTQEEIDDAIESIKKAGQ